MRAVVNLARVGYFFIDSCTLYKRAMRRKSKDLAVLEIDEMCARNV